MNQEGEIIDVQAYTTYLLHLSFSRKCIIAHPSHVIQKILLFRKKN